MWEVFGAASSRPVLHTCSHVSTIRTVLSVLGSRSASGSKMNKSEMWGVRPGYQGPPGQVALPAHPQLPLPFRLPLGPCPVSGGTLLNVWTQAKFPQAQDVSRLEEPKPPIPTVVEAFLSPAVLQGPQRVCVCVGGGIFSFCPQASSNFSRPCRDIWAPPSCPYPLPPGLATVLRRLQFPDLIWSP